MGAATKQFLGIRHQPLITNGYEDIEMDAGYWIPRWNEKAGSSSIDQSRKTVLRKRRALRSPFVQHIAAL